MNVSIIVFSPSGHTLKAAEMIKPIDAKGKGEWILEMDCKDTEGNIIASSVCHYYIKKMN